MPDRVPDTDHTQLAVLIDCDNSSGSQAEAVLAELSKYGTLTVKRAYGDWTTGRLVQWKDALNQNAITPMQQFAYTQGKNSTDSALIIDAMDLLYAGYVDGFAIVSSDSDFTRLATRLRESGKVVYGLGRRDTPEAFVKACNRFVFLEVLGRTETDDDEPEAPAEADLARLQSLLTKAVNSTSRDDGWADLGSVGQYLSRNDAAFDARNYGFGRLSDLARRQPFLEVTQPGEGGGQAVRVRLKPTRSRSGSAAKKATPKTASKNTASKR